MSVAPTLQIAQAAGFKLGGEPSVALDLIDTMLHAHAPDRTDLLEDKSSEWWELQAGRLPLDEEPPSDDTDRLRTALREIIESRIDGQLPSSRAIIEVNRFASGATPIPHLETRGSDLVERVVWEKRFGGSARLSAIARDGIALVADPDLAPLLRRCSNPTCTMVFLAENPRRMWCAANVCGNRMRVARHQERHSPTKVGGAR